MSKAKKMEISALFHYDYKLERYQCLNPSFELLYDDYLNKRNIELMYHGEDLLKYINRQKESLLEFETNEEYFKKINKKERLNFIRKCLYRGLIPASIIAALIAFDDFEIHQKSNILNSYGIYTNLAKDVDHDGIEEIDTTILNDVTNLNKPTDDKFYKHSNPMYNLVDEPTISDNVSFMVALNAVDKDLIKINGETYSKTGFVTKITYELNNQRGVITTSKVFNNMEQIRSFLKQVLVIDKSNYKLVVKEYSRNSVRLFEDIPTINKSQEDGKISFEEPNYLYTKVMKKLLKIK